MHPTTWSQRPVLGAARVCVVAMTLLDFVLRWAPAEPEARRRFLLDLRALLEIERRIAVARVPAEAPAS